MELNQEQIQHIQKTYNFTLRNVIREIIDKLDDDTYMKINNNVDSYTSTDNNAWKVIRSYFDVYDKQIDIAYAKYRLCNDIYDITHFIF